MIKYIVTWGIAVIASCPNKQLDEYGRMPLISCSAYHTKVEVKERTFYDRDSAIAFYKNAPSGALIDSIKTK